MEKDVSLYKLIQKGIFMICKILLFIFLFFVIRKIIIRKLSKKLLKNINEKK